MHPTWFLLTETAPAGDFAGGRLAQKSPRGLYRVQLDSPRAGIEHAWRILVIGTHETLIHTSLTTDLAPPYADGAPPCGSNPESPRRPFGRP